MAEKDFVILGKSGAEEPLGLPKPREIPLHTPMPHPVVGFFGKAELEWSAGKLLAFLQARSGEWEMFKLSDLVAFYQQQDWDVDKAFFGLCGWWFNDSMYTLAYEEAQPMVICMGEHWAVTDLFVAACQKKRPGSK